MSTEFERFAGVSASCVRYKYQRLRERLRGAIETGELAGKLPGERELARRYRANAKTINKALSDLTTEGVLVRHVGRGTFVADGQPGYADAGLKPLRFGWLAPGDTSCVRHGDYYLQAEQIIRGKGHRLDRLGPAAGLGNGIPEDALSPGELRGLDGVILFSSRPSAGFLANLHRRHVPLVIANNCHERIKTPVVLADYAQGGLELCQHLIHLGHREIQLLISPRLLPAAGAAENGYRATMHRYGLRPHEAQPTDDAFDWRHLLDSSCRPTALICVGAAPAVEASSRARDAGLTMPSMLSISVLPEPGETIIEEQSLTAYEVAPARIVHWATELLLSASPGQLPRSVIIPGQLRDRGSAAPPRSAGQATITPPEEAVL